MSDIEYSFITSEVIKSFDCILMQFAKIKLSRNFGAVTVLCLMGGSRAAGRMSGATMENINLLYAPLDILVWIPLRSNLAPVSSCFL